MFTSPLTAATFSTACHSEKERRNDILAKSSRDRLLESALCSKYLLETIIVHKLFIDIFKEVFFTAYNFSMCKPVVNTNGIDEINSAVID